MKAEYVKLSQISTNDANPRLIKDDKFEKLVRSILVLPKMLELRPIVVDGDYIALGGNMRFRALNHIAAMTPEEITETLADIKEYKKKTDGEQEALQAYWFNWLENPNALIINADNLTAEEKREFIIKDNVGFGEWDMDILANEWDADELEEWGLEVWHTEPDETAPEERPKTDDTSGTLSERFIVPPFSILDSRQGYWQERKKAWKATIGTVGESREDTLVSAPQLKYKDLYQKTYKHRKELGISFEEYLKKYVTPEELAHEEQKMTAGGVSLFDPVLAELLCHWFTPSEGSKIIDPFAGDTYKGQVFAMSGREFVGIELRPEQVEINNRTIADLNLPIRYICDDGQNVANHFEPESQDLLFSCPPYFDLEQYSDDPKDASNQANYEDFLQIIKNGFIGGLSRLKENRFAVIVIGDVRDKKTGAYYDIMSDFKRMFREAGAHLYNEIILIEQSANSALRAANMMRNRKVVKMHQNILVFYKGDPKKIKKNFPELTISEDDISKFLTTEMEG